MFNFDSLYDIFVGGIFFIISHSSKLIYYLKLMKKLEIFFFHEKFQYWMPSSGHLKVYTETKIILPL